MSKFDELMEQYKSEVLEEQPPDPAAAPAPDATADPAAAPVEEPEAEGPSPEDVVNELEKSSKKPWADLAGVLGRAMEYRWSDEDIKRINDSMPGGLTIRDFINIRTSPSIKDKYDANIVSAAVNLFDQVDTLMGKDDMDEIIPAEER